MKKKRKPNPPKKFGSEKSYVTEYYVDTDIRYHEHLSDWARSFLIMPVPPCTTITFAIHNESLSQIADKHRDKKIIKVRVTHTKYGVVTTRVPMTLEDFSYILSASNADLSHVRHTAYMMLRKLNTEQDLED